jgi:arylsulfatase A-like enzyme
MAALAAPPAGWDPVSQRPSVLLVVLDTARADAVSAYGTVQGTTPAVDALAAGGLLFRRAYANSSWTIPSHATLFTGLLPGRHGVGVRRWSTPAGLTTLAERLREAGYDTAGFSENPMLKVSGLDRGFEVFHDVDPEHSQVIERFRGWMEGRSRKEPFFAFVNLMDPHVPYRVREVNRFLPPGETIQRANEVEGRVRVQPMCRDHVSAEDLAVLKGLYLGDVAAADAKVRELVRLARDQPAGRPLITVVTADHGENFGEHRLLGHLFQITHALIHVPLVVAGLPGVQPATVSAPVQLADLLPSILMWAGLDVPAGLPGRVLPTSDEVAGNPRTIVAEYTDIATLPLEAGQPVFSALRAAAESQRQGCVPADDVFGDMRSAVAYPYRVHWSPARPSRLYDVGSDPQERVDLARTRADIVVRLESHLKALGWEGETPSGDAATAPATLAPGVLERLRALGYGADP